MILGSYKELKKAMGQVFGTIDERKDAAERLQRLRQTRSVTDYITDFQMITSNLDWDEEALEDKFLEGLKTEIRKALIYYPNPRTWKSCSSAHKGLIEKFGDNQMISEKEEITETPEPDISKRNKRSRPTATEISK